MDEDDGPWKEALEAALPDCLAILYPALHGIIDWGLDHESLDAELPKFQPEAVGGTNRADRLVRASRKGTGDERFIHAEAQMTPEDEFGLRMYRYGYRGRDRFKKPLIALAILGDDDPAWRPDEYREGELESETVYKFRSVKLLDLLPRMAELEAGGNLFGLFLVAHLETLATKKDPEARCRAKLRLMRNLIIRGLSQSEEGTWARLLDWLMKVPDEYNLSLWDELRSMKGEDMPFITPFERYAAEEGRTKGLADCRADGLAKGLADGRADGLAKGLHGGLRALLKGKFKEEGEALAAAVSARDAAWVEAAIERLAEADTLEKARKALEIGP